MLFWPFSTLGSAAGTWCCTKPGGTLWIWTSGKFGSAGITVGVGAGGEQMSPKIVASWRRAASWFELVGKSGAAGDGFCRACIKSLAAAAAASAEEAVGITVFDGNQERVSAILSAMVALTQTL